MPRHLGQSATATPECATTVFTALAALFTDVVLATDMLSSLAHQDDQEYEEAQLEDQVSHVYYVITSFICDVSCGVHKKALEPSNTVHDDKVHNRDCH
jgi:hypothetical protein